MKRIVLIAVFVKNGFTSSVLTLTKIIAHAEIIWQFVVKNVLIHYFPFIIFQIKNFAELTKKILNFHVKYAITSVIRK